MEEMFVPPVSGKCLRLLAVVPDALTATLYLIAWMAPRLPGAAQVRALVLTMAVEFVVMQSSAFFFGIGLMDATWRRRQIGLIVGLVLFYFVFIAGLAWEFHGLWPVFSFAWLLLSRFLPLWLGRGSATLRDRLMSGWIVSLSLFFIGAFATALLPLPRLGLTPAVVQSLRLPGGGLWVEQPWTVMAFGAFYFGAQAWIKYRDQFASRGQGAVTQGG